MSNEGSRAPIETTENYGTGVDFEYTGPEFPKDKNGRLDFARMESSAQRLTAVTLEVGKITEDAKLTGEIMTLWGMATSLGLRSGLRNRISGDGYGDLYEVVREAVRLEDEGVDVKQYVYLKSCLHFLSADYETRVARGITRVGKREQEKPRQKKNEIAEHVSAVVLEKLGLAELNEPLHAAFEGEHAELSRDLVVSSTENIVYIFQSMRSHKVDCVDGEQLGVYSALVISAGLLDLCSNGRRSGDGCRLSIRRDVAPNTEDHTRESPNAGLRVEISSDFGGRTNRGVTFYVSRVVSGDPSFVELRYDSGGNLAEVAKTGDAHESWELPKYGAVLPNALRTPEEIGKWVAKQDLIWTTDSAITPDNEKIARAGLRKIGSTGVAFPLDSVTSKSNVELIRAMLGNPAENLSRKPQNAGLNSVLEVLYTGL